MAVRQRANGRWIAYWREPGKRSPVKKSFGHGPEGEAQARAFDSQRTYKKTKPRRPTGGPLVEEIAAYYYENKKFKTQNSREHLKIRLEANILPFLGGKHAAHLTDEDLDAYVAHRHDKDGVKYSTVNRELNDVQALLNFAANRRPPLIPRNPVTGYKKPPSDDAVILPPNHDEIASILSVTSAHLTRFVYLCLYLGARPGYREILTLKWGSVQWHQHMIVVISAKKGGAPIRNVPLHVNFEAILGAWYEIDRKRFGPGLVNEKGIVNYHGRSIQKIGKAWRGTLTRAKITRRIRPYDLRHQFASDLLSRGEDLKTVSEIMGSAPATILKHYQHVNRPQHRRAIDNLGL